MVALLLREMAEKSVIDYIGNNMPCGLSDTGIHWGDKDLIEIETNAVIGKYEILIMEVRDDIVDSMLKWIFNVSCKQNISIIAFTVELSSKNKLILNRIGIEEYIEFGFDTAE